MILGFKEYKEYCRIKKLKECDAKSLQKFYKLSHYYHLFLKKKLVDNDYKCFCRIFNHDADKLKTFDIYTKIEHYFKLLMELDNAKDCAKYDLYALTENTDYDYYQHERLEKLEYELNEMFDYIKTTIEELWDYEMEGGDQ